MLSEQPSSHYVAAALDADIRVMGKPTRGLFVGTGGTLSVRRPDGVDVSFGAVPTGAVLPISAIRVNSSGTLATGLVLLY